jgi:hypothetical protein
MRSGDDARFGASGTDAQSHAAGSTSENSAHQGYHRHGIINSMSACDARKNGWIKQTKRRDRQPV